MRRDARRRASRCRAARSCRDRRSPSHRVHRAGSRTGWRRHPGRDGAPRTAPRSRRTGIEPVQIVHDDEHRRRLGCGREQGERAGGDQVSVVGWYRRAPTDGGLERSSLRRRDAVEVVTEGSQQLQQAGMVEPSLGLDAAGVGLAGTRWPSPPLHRAVTSCRCRPRRRSRARQTCRHGQRRARGRCARAALLVRLRPPRTPEVGGFPEAMPRPSARRSRHDECIDDDASTTTTLRRALSGMLRIGAVASITTPGGSAWSYRRPPGTLDRARAVEEAR